MLYSNCTIDTGTKPAFRFYNSSQRNVVTYCAILSKTPFDMTEHGVAPVINEANFTGNGNIPSGVGYTKKD